MVMQFAWRRRGGDLRRE